MKANISFQFKTGPWGGGNQFLKALKNEFVKRGIYQENPEAADIILFNSHHNLGKILKLKLKYPQKKFVHRIDGPIFLIRNRDFSIDKLIFKFSEKIASFSVFQSRWSFEKCKTLGFENNDFSIIHNAPDNLIFNKIGKLPFKSSGKIRIIASCWAANPMKGFDTYKYLDDNLDFEKYDFVFIGNSPVKFKNIIHINPLPSKELAEELKNSDIFITASKNDPCSNSLIEALSCGLPAVVYNGGGHPELLMDGGELFDKKEEVISKIEKIVNNYNEYQKAIPEYKMEKIAEEYLAVFDKTIKDNRVKKINFSKYLHLAFLMLLSRLKSFFKIKR